MVVSIDPASNFIKVQVDPSTLGGPVIAKY